MVIVVFLLPSVSEAAQRRPPPVDVNTDGTIESLLDWLPGAIVGTGDWGTVARYHLPFLNSLAQTVLKIIGWVVYQVMVLLSLLLNLAGAALDGVMKVNSFLDVPGVQIGWRFVRNICNMFFVLILLAIGFATIFRVEGYGAKRLLVKLIIAAILVNFSFLISGLIIDASQVLMNGLITNLNLKTYSSSVIKAAGIGYMFSSHTTASGQGSNRLKDYTAIIGDNADNTTLLLVIVADLIKSCVLLGVAAFAFLVIFCILVIRIVALWILIILSPFAYTFAILPKTQSLANQWWERFLKYCFIGPIMVFFLSLVLIIGQGMDTISTQFEGTGASATLANKPIFATTTPVVFFQFVVIIILLLASAFSSMFMSIAGAGKVIAGAKGLAKGMGRATGVPRAARATGAFARRGAVTGAAGVLSRVPGFRGVARRMKGAELKRQEKEMEKKSGMYAAMSDKDLTEATQKDVGINRMTAIREAQKRGLFRNAPEKQVKAAMATASTFGDTAILEKIEATRPGLVADPTRRAKAFADARRSGEYKKFSGYAFSDNPEEMTQFTNQLGPAAAKKWYDDLEKPEQDALRQSYLQSRSIAIDPGARENYAKITGDVSPAFQGFPNEAAAFIPKMKIKNITDMKDTPNNLNLLTEHMTEGQATSLAASPDLSGTLAKEIKNRIMAKPMPAGPMGARVKRLQDIMNANPFWSTV